MAQKLFDVCGVCNQPRRTLDAVEIKAVNVGMVEKGYSKAEATKELADLMCPLCWERFVRFFKRGVTPAGKTDAAPVASKDSHRLDAEKE